MPAAEGYMSPGEAEQLRKLLGQQGPGAAVPSEFSALTQEYQTATNKLAEIERSMPRSEHVATLRRIPIIGTTETEDVWIKG